MVNSQWVSLDFLRWLLAREATKKSRAHKHICKNVYHVLNISTQYAHAQMHA